MHITDLVLYFREEGYTRILDNGKSYDLLQWAHDNAAAILEDNRTHVFYPNTGFVYVYDFDSVGNRFIAHFYQLGGKTAWTSEA